MLFSFRHSEVIKVSAIIVAGALITSVIFLLVASSQGKYQLERGLSVAAKSEAALLDQFYVTIAEDTLHFDSTRVQQIMFEGIVKSNKNVASFGTSAMLLIGRVNDDSIEFILPKTTPEESQLRVANSSLNAEPMQRALVGLSGTMTGKDYRGVDVIAAYEPIPHLGMGLVIKIDAEEEGRNIWANLQWLVLISLLGTSLAVYLAIRVLLPKVRKLQIDKAELTEEISRRQGLEDELVRMYESYRDLVENINDVFYELTEDGTVTYVSPVVNKVLGYRPNGLLNRNFAEYLHPEDFECTMQQFKDSLEGNSYPADFRLLKSDGSYCWIRTSSQAIESAGKIVGVRGVFMDISERKSIESDLEESLEWLCAITDTARDGVVLIDDNGQICFWNPAAEQLFGFSAEEAIGKNVHDLIAPEELREGIVCPMAHWKTTGLGDSIGKTTMFNATTKNGSTVPIELSLATTELRGKKYAVGLVRDVTDRMKTESALRESEYRFRKVVESLSEGLMITTLEGTVFFANQRIAEMCGYEVPDMLDMPLNVIIEDKHRAAVKEMLSRRAAGKSDRYEVELKRKDGSTFWVAVNAVPFADSTNTITGSLALLTDITDRKLAEAERSGLESQLRQAQKMEAIGTLAGGIAHDFNNILTPILAYSELVASSSNDQQTTSDVRRVIEAALRAKDLVKQILTFSRQTEQEHIPLSPVPIIKEALKLLRASVPVTIDIRHNIQSSCEILADPTQIHQIVFNLCTNAAHAMRNDGGIMEIELVDDVCPSCIETSGALAANQQCLRLSVSDTGCGIDDETLSHIFEPFFTTKGVGEGTGLGLSVVHGIVKSAGGAIRVQSSPGHGTRFDLYFPVTATRLTLPDELTLDQLEGSEHILLVDDEPDIAVSCARTLEQYGYYVATRTSSTDGFEAFKAHPRRFDLVITDYTMPHMTGVQLAEKIRGLRPDVPIIMMTGFSLTVDNTNLTALGFDAVIFKPIVGSELAAAIRGVLDRTRDRRSTTDDHTLSVPEV